MTEQRMALWPRLPGWAFGLLLVAMAPGCVHQGAIPVRHLPPRFLQCDCKTNEVPIDFSLLRQDAPEEHIVGPNDVLGVQIKNILGNEADQTIVLPPSDLLPAVGAGRPYKVRRDGTINLPMVGDLQLDGMTIPEANETVRTAYLDAGFLNEATAEVEIRLLQPRKVKIHVIRQDTESSIPLALRRDQIVHSKHGSSATVELPVYENDVLHALDRTGGLPGIDAKNELWIIRGNQLRQGESQQLVQRLGVKNAFGGSGQQDLEGRVTRIPLRLAAGEVLNLTEQDIILNEGDILFIGSRETEFFITGGLLNGGQTPLPRDYDVDVLTALAMVNGNTLGPASGATSNNFQFGPGNIMSPSRLIIIRQLEDGEQIKILVDLKRAINDESERVNIQPGDLLILKYTTAELMTNVLLNIVNLNYSLGN